MAPAAACRQLQADGRYSPGTREAGSRDPPGPVCLAQSGVRTNQVTVRPPRRRQPHLAARAATSSSPRPLSASPPAGRSRGTPSPPRSVTSTRTRPSPSVTATATSWHGCPGPSTPPESAGNLRPPRARGPRAGTCAPTWPSVAVRGKADGATGRPNCAHRPSELCAPTALTARTPVRYTSVDSAPRRSIALQDDTRRDREETARKHENSQLAGRFRRWGQVLGSNQRRLSDGFTDRPSKPSPVPLTSGYVI